MAPLIPTWTQPSHPKLIEVIRGDPKEFASWAISRVALPAGSLFTPITAVTPAAAATYASFQIGDGRHIDINSDLVYCNHSCEPSLEFDLDRREVRVARGRALQVGDPLTWFYPSAEWEMAQPFECLCGAPQCLGRIGGASHISTQKLRGYWLNRHIADKIKKG